MSCCRCQSTACMSNAMAQASHVVAWSGMAQQHMVWQHMAQHATVVSWHGWSMATHVHPCRGSTWHEAAVAQLASCHSHHGKPSTQTSPVTACSPNTEPVACGQLGVRSPLMKGRKVTPWQPGGSSDACSSEPG